ncbi:hypothetical protein JAAARDRAFT_126845 [Jaapia argillacea MUCL 33604]|uniref:Non-haem dioxygenase N-terminal domain-containing protein n=1 Tax=Jaapia argillacea MUCL 33604 TaxID=933084 RepID=A0A067PXZ7_9AGAM|nr:hypothetical protein JAAARDRAFT_126845 [Jaapia argillacea MUCL 33604]
MSSSIPVIDVSSLFSPHLEGRGSKIQQVSKAINDVCTTWGFFQITGHNISPVLSKSLLKAVREFFSLPDEKKLALHVKKGGVAWRGYMPLGGEGTHGRVDHK